jgi:hypothetical protein
MSNLKLSREQKVRNIRLARVRGIEPEAGTEDFMEKIAEKIPVILVKIAKLVPKGKAK